MSRRIKYKNNFRNQILFFSYFMENYSRRVRKSTNKIILALMGWTSVEFWMWSSFKLILNIFMYFAPHKFLSQFRSQHSSYFITFDALHPGQHFFSHVWTFSMVEPVLSRSVLLNVATQCLWWDSNQGTLNLKLLTLSLSYCALFRSPVISMYELWHLISNNVVFWHV